MKNTLAAFICGLIFALGLGISGMTDANKVFGFLNLAGDWDPSLAFVMVGAIGVHLVSYRLITKRNSPLLAPDFILPNNQALDRPLILGAAIFGIGWGLGGFCPGPAIVSFSGLASKPVIFTASMIVGIGIYQFRPNHQSAEATENADACG